MEIFGDAGRGDFNVIRELNEVCGTSGDIREVMEEFNACIQDTGLLSLPMQERFSTSYYYSLTSCTSDHSSLVLYGDRQQQLRDIFRFDNYLTLSPNYIASVQNIWQHEVVGVPMYAITRKLQALKPAFLHMRCNKGDLTINVQLAKGFLETAQQLVSTERRNELFVLLEYYCRLVYTKAVKLEQIMLQQRAKMQWMDERGESMFTNFLS
ncbi:UNVERIFIED_CONTAM: hypothetical protein Sindi_1313700 [Sesamum indicum]